jgi:hypothetical protein
MIMVQHSLNPRRGQGLDGVVMDEWAGKWDAGSGVVEHPTSPIRSTVLVMVRCIGYCNMELIVHNA